MRWIYLIISMTNCHILGFNLPFTELNNLVWFLCKSQLNTDNRVLDTLYIQSSRDKVAPTNLPCSWIEPAGSKIAPMAAVNDIDFTTPCKNLKMLFLILFGILDKLASPIQRLCKCVRIDSLQHLSLKGLHKTIPRVNGKEP